MSVELLGKIKIHGIQYSPRPWNMNLNMEVEGIDSKKLVEGRISNFFNIIFSLLQKLPI
jgi:hypothetical protein